jgi:hypothetical protein
MSIPCLLDDFMLYRLVKKNRAAPSSISKTALAAREQGHLKRERKHAPLDIFQGCHIGHHLALLAMS